jgi:hypothetical protein
VVLGFSPLRSGLSI